MAKNVSRHIPYGHFYTFLCDNTVAVYGVRLQQPQVCSTVCVLGCSVFLCHLSLALKKALCYVIASSTNENDPCQHNGVSHTNNMT